MYPFIQDLDPGDGIDEAATCEFLPVFSTMDPKERRGYEATLHLALSYFHPVHSNGGRSYVAILPEYERFLDFSPC